MSSLRVKRPSLSDNRTRVSFFLPCNVGDEEIELVDDQDSQAVMKSPRQIKHLRVLNGVIRYLTSLQTDEENNIQGFTISNYPKTSFTGAWYNSEDFKMPDGTTLAKGWWMDNIVQLIVDYHYHHGSSDLNEAIASLKTSVSAIYASNGCFEAEYWIVAHHVSRFE